MNGSLDFAMAWWWCPLLLAPGLWLTKRLYLRRGAAHRGPAVLHATAWLLLAVWAVSPTWRSYPEIWHPPLVVLAVDASPGYEALGARDSGQGARAAARIHYEALGFRVIEADVSGQLPGGEAYPNLQAVLLWSDARTFGLGTLGASAPVFPVVAEVATGEVQGESAFVAVREKGGPEAVILAVEWRALGSSPAGAHAELRADGEVVWRGALAHPQAVRAGGRVTSEVTLPAPAREAAERAGAELVVLVKPAAQRDNVLSANDTVMVNASRIRRTVQAFVRPVATLEERGLMDALREEPGFHVAALRAAEARAVQGGMVLWTASGREVPGRRLRSGEAVAGMIRYHVATRKTGAQAHVRGTGIFGVDARIERAAGVTAFLPAGVLRLADLGFADAAPDGEGGWELTLENENVEVLAWAVQEGRRGLLLWRDRNSDIYDFVVPPLWNLRFQSEAGAAFTATSSASLAPAWVRGAARWVIAHPGSAARGEQAGAAEAAVSPSPASDSARPLARLGIDAEAMASLAARHGGRILYIQGNVQGSDDRGAENVWPELPDGDVRETRTRTVPLAPAFPFALALALMLGSLWIWRKQRQLD